MRARAGDPDCVSFDGAASVILKLSKAFLTNDAGDLLITDAGEVDPPAKLFVVHWDGAKFVSRSISYIRPDNSNGQFEHVTFAPIQIRDL